ncbi:tubulin-specific chaperone cofactor E-like protein [Lytechinus pictus]|uniref:tubulin-specific chaperone cofactor E-like protein n=1 Tax=Lytechinus pictus TaxID=7653 RepID=UPI0030B9C165
MPKSFVEALKAKYCEDEEDASNFVVSFVFTNRPRKNSGGEGEAELGYLTSMVLSMNSITHAGISSDGLASLCPNVTDLDISNNLIGCWDEVISILRSLDKLQFVNLSGNRIQDPKKSLANLSGVRFGIENLVLNNTGVSWGEILLICRCLPRLRELHASQNGYTDIQASAECLRECFGKLEVLHLTDNNYTSWEQVIPLSLLPALHTLMLSENPLSNIHYVVAIPGKEDGEDVNNKMDVCSDNRPDPVICDVVTEILDKLIEDASTMSTQTSQDDPSCSPSHRVSDPSYDSGMEDCQPNTPRRIPKERLSSQGSEDGDPCGDSGYGAMRQDNPLVAEKAVHQVLPGISEHGAKPVPLLSPKSEDKRRKLSEKKPLDASGTVPESDNRNDEVLADINTDKFAYFEIAWDADEAIGHEEEEVVEMVETVEEIEEEMPSICPFTWFPNLKVLCVTNTKVDQWSDVESIRAFPCLESLRVKGVPFLKNLASDERRKLLVASLPNIKILNGSEIKEEEREKSERFFIRHFDEHPEPPSWIEDLVNRHGALKPITEIDISRGYQEHAHLSFVYSGRCIHQATIHVVQNVSELRKYCAKLLDKPKTVIRMYHHSKCPHTGETELNLLHQDLLPMSRYDMTHGDEIHIETPAFIPPLTAAQRVSRSLHVSIR